MYEPKYNNKNQRASMSKTVSSDFFNSLHRPEPKSVLKTTQSKEVFKNVYL